MNTQNDQFKTHFLNDKPCEEEGSFEIHRRIAGAIAEEIEMGEPSNIALLASWGLGKSTALKMIESRLGDSYVFVVFDAWAHSGETLRKSFIEKLAYAVYGEGSEGAKSFMKSLESTESEIESDERTSFRPLPAALLISAGIYFFLTTLASAICGTVLPLLPLSGEGEALKASDFGSVISLCSLGVATIFFFLLKRVLKKRYPDSSKPKQESDNGVPRWKRIIGWLGVFLDDLSAFFAKKSTGNSRITKVETTSSLDSCQFEKYYDFLIEEARKEGKRVVIAFDNLDRLDPDNMAAAWTTLQVFCSSGVCVEKPSRSWIILPITRKAFSELEGITAERSSKGDLTDISLSKLFIRNFEIPTLINTEWKKYFIGLAKVAFPDTDDATIASIYAIASHCLMDTEMRTPRNAKRFLNSMVAQSRVYKNTDLLSIAAFCYLHDVYELKRIRNKEGGSVAMSFSYHVSETLEGRTDDSAYIESLAYDNSALDDDLIMMAFGQFEAEQAAEAHTLFRFSRAISKNEEIDLSFFLKGNSGSWEIIESYLEDQLLTDSGLETPPWVFILLKSLDATLYDFDEAYEAERKRLIRLLMSHIASFQETDFVPSSGSIARHLSICSTRTVNNICDAVMSHVNSLNIFVDEGEPGNDLPEFIRNASCVIQALVDYSEASKSRVEKSLGPIEFGDAYNSVVEAAYYGAKRDAKTRNWISLRPASSVNEVCSVLGPIKDYAVGGSEDYEYIAFVRSMNLLSKPLIDDEALPEARAILDLTNEPSDKKIAFWILKNLCKIESPNIDAVLSDIPFDMQDYSQYAEVEDPSFDLAISSLCIAYGEALDENGKPNSLIKLHFNEACVCHAKERGIDLFESIITLSGKSGSHETAKMMLERFWNEGDTKKRSLEDCFKYLRIVTLVEKRKELGKQLISAGRLDELTNTTFNCAWASMYLGALDGSDDSSKLKQWIMDGFRAMTTQGWADALDLKQTINALPLLKQVCDKEERLPQLDDVIENRIRMNEYSHRISESLSLYGFDHDKFNKAITEVFFQDGVDWRETIKRYGSAMTQSKWLGSLAAQQKQTAICNIIDNKAALYVEWLRDDIRSHDNLSEHLHGCTKVLKERIKFNLGLKTAKRNARFVEACEEIQALIAP